MESQPGVIPSISYAELFHDDSDTRYAATIQLIQALKAHGASADCSNSGATTKSRFVPFASEKIRGEAHRSEAVELQYGVYESAGNWSQQGRRLADASRLFHELRYYANCTAKHSECNRIVFNLLDCLSSSLNLPRSLSTIHSKQNSFFAPYHYRFEDDQEDNNPLRVPPHIGPTTMLFCFQDSYAGLEVADLSNQSGKLSTTAIEKTAIFTPTNPQPSEFVLLVGHVLRRLVNGVKHSVHRIKRPVGTSGYHLNYWIIPDLNTDCDFADKKEDVTGYLARVFPAALQNTVQV
ncbi:Clavaminate synthase-like protein [Aspergillus caelatus]|uniref:Clavaminate synthase-like protein n=1 Tax=Aspergillus caelatus TaxID=61420 RepID=A0A5N6ZT73_9EURO|nr:Clavaminate synthase-like protein [Aspergillus caelatus]KAE8360747.1 Clavaminate synthase-like protein [Aspergillus caelatus]